MIIMFFERASRPKRPSVLIVEDNVQLASCLEMLLEAHSYEVCRTIDGNGGLESIKLMDFDVIVCDLLMPGMNGDRLLRAVGELKPRLCDRFIFMSGDPERRRWSETATCMGRPIFWKPFAVGELLAAINELAHSKTRASKSAPAEFGSRGREPELAKRAI